MLVLPPDDPILAFRHAFRRSRVRVEILLVLLEYGRQNLPDLARLVGAFHVNVHGAIWGDKDQERYRIADSLATLGLIDVHEADGTLVYELTLLGQAVARRLREEVDRRRGLRPVIRT